MSDIIKLASALIACPSVTPQTAGVFDVLENFLKPLGFVVHRVTFGDGEDAVENLYARIGTAEPNFCFAGHTDVVPAGDVEAWSVPPFAPKIVNGELVGRGAEDMKGAIAAFMIATRDFLQTVDGAMRSHDGRGEPERSERGGALAGESFPHARSAIKGSISLLITQDEEGNAIHGTKPMLGWLAERGEKLSHCLVGEPTNPDFLGEMIKIGRRGSVSFKLLVRGVQGHAAYPERADNPVTRILNMLHALKNTELDEGTEHFPPSNLEVTSIDVGNPTTNIIPASASARFNIRFNDKHTSASLTEWVKKTCAEFGEVTLSHHVTGEAFLNHDEKLQKIVVDAVTQITGQRPALSTTGGTSDARFIKDVCPVIEFGTTGRFAHQVDERVEVATLEGLAKVYQRVLENYFAAD